MSQTESRGGLAAFCEAEHPRLVAAMTLHTGDRELGREIAQEALARAVAGWERVGALDSPAAWTYRVAVNLANSHFRRRRYERAARDRVAARAADRWIDAEYVDGSPLRAAVAALPRRQREAVILRYLLDLSIDETAVRMACASGTVRALTSQGLTSLRRQPPLMAGGGTDDD